MSANDRIKLRHLHGLVAIAEHGTAVRAARALSITQPAVSKTLAELEDIVGQPLFVRSRTGVTLTGAGRTLLRYAGSSLRTLREGLDTLASPSGADAPRLLIGVLPNVAATVLPPALLRFAAAEPHARICVRTGSNNQLIAALRQGELDLVVGRLAEPSEMQGLSFEHLYTETLVFAVRAGHPLAAAARIQPSALRDHRLLLPDAGTRARDAADRFFVASGIGLPEDVVETIDASFARSYVLQSQAIWCAPLGVVENDVRHGALQRLPIDTESTRGPVGLTLRAGQLPSQAMQRLVAEIRIGAAERAGPAPNAGPR